MQIENTLQIFDIHYGNSVTMASMVKTLQLFYPPHEHPDKLIKTFVS